ncbi:MAG: type II toxin-antitoxin system PemK/MazF family toxin [Myxococcales bacterium]|nr:type II toxin-antitoxin system PemK/MazF family toxin [Myxococcales bacterium]
MRSLFRTLWRMLRILFGFEPRGDAGALPPAEATRARARQGKPKRAAPTEVFRYAPSPGGGLDPGEIVWMWVPYEDDPRQGKDRPVLLVGHRGRRLLGVPLTSKRREGRAAVSVGAGPWDAEGRVSYARVDRLLEVDPGAVRREGAVLAEARFSKVIAALEALRAAA